VSVKGHQTQPHWKGFINVHVNTVWRVFHLWFSWFWGKY